MPRARSTQVLPDGTCIVQRCVDWGDDLAWVTLTELGCIGVSPGRPDLLVSCARLVLSGQHGTGRTTYINPEFTVAAPHGEPTEDFLLAARRAQKTFLAHLKSILFSSRRVKNTMREVDPISRQLTFSGVMIINGKHIHPSRWPQPKHKNQVGE
jgi:hypothetical protein